MVIISSSRSSYCRKEGKKEGRKEHSARELFATGNS